MQSRKPNPFTTGVIDYIRHSAALKSYALSLDTFSISGGKPATKSLTRHSISDALTTITASLSKRIETEHKLSLGRLTSSDEHQASLRKRQAFEEIAKRIYGIQPAALIDFLDRVDSIIDIDRISSQVDVLRGKSMRGDDSGVLFRGVIKISAAHASAIYHEVKDEMAPRSRDKPTYRAAAI